MTELVHQLRQLVLAPAAPQASVLSASEVASLLQVAPSTLRRWCARGEGPPMVRLPNGKLRASEASVLAWLTALPKVQR